MLPTQDDADRPYTGALQVLSTMLRNQVVTIVILS